MGTIWAIARAIGKKYCTRLLLLIRQVRVSLRPKGGLKEGTKMRRRIFLAKRPSQGKCPNGSSKLCQFLVSLKKLLRQIWVRFNGGYLPHQISFPAPKNTNSRPCPHHRHCRASSHSSLLLLSSLLSTSPSFLSSFHLCYG